MGQAAEPTAGPDPVPHNAGEDVDLTGRTLGEFYLLRRLGIGGMGQVYLAEQLSLKRKVALKLLRPGLAANTTALARFKAEAEAVARVTHANIVQVYAIGEMHGFHFMALEYVDGRNLRQFLEKKGPPDVQLTLSIMRQVAAALQRACELGLIHRDIKPENILLTRKGEVKVADFGLSRFADTPQPLNLTQTGVTMGTPLYMSPEQVEGKPVDPRTDIYAFGVTCYHLLAGQPPFRGQTAFEVAVQHVQKTPPPLNEVRPDLPPELCAIVHKMMAKDPADRYQTGREIIRDVVWLRDALAAATGVSNDSGAGGPSITMIAAGPPLSSLMETPPTASKTQPLLPVHRRSLWPWLFGSGVLVAVLAGLLWGWLANRPAPAVQAVPQPDDPTVESLFQRNREKMLVAYLELDAKAAEKRDIIPGLKIRIELGVIYLKDRARLAEADAFFKDLEKNDQVKAYRDLGKLGRAIVLAFNGEAKESNKLFIQFLDEQKGKLAGEGRKVIWATPELREMVAEALNHNATNLGLMKLPDRLESLRNPPVPLLKGPPPGKGG